MKVFGESGGDSRTLFASRLCYLVASEVDSRMVLGEENSMAAWLPAIKGRGIFKFGVDLKEIQTMYLPLDTPEDNRRSLEAHIVKRWDDEPGAIRLSPRKGNYPCPGRLESDGYRSDTPQVLPVPFRETQSPGEAFNTPS